jgi:hypothetical protein
VVEVIRESSPLCRRSVSSWCSAPVRGHDRSTQTLDIAAVEQALRTDGFSGQQGLFSRECAAELDEDLLALFQEAWSWASTLPAQATPTATTCR